MEVCVDSVESAVNAERGGASRVELCSSLVEGGTTPSLGTLRVVKRSVKIPVFVMLRPRGGDFLYTGAEFQVMLEDLQLLKENGADGIVFGVLTREGGVDRERCEQIVELARPLPVTFHRAFDMTRSPEECLGVLVELGVERVLTSGGESSALEGVPILRRLVEVGGAQIIVVPGGGITERNLRRILEGTGAREFHCSARTTKPSPMTYCNTGVSMGAKFGPPEFSVKVADRDRVNSLLDIAKGMWGQ